MKNIAIILLGGSSSRFEYKTAKQFFDINGKPVAFYAIKPFLDSKYINEIVLVCRKEDISYYKELLKCEKKDIHYVIGGDSRSQSSKNAHCWQFQDVFVLQDSRNPRRLPRHLPGADLLFA